MQASHSRASGFTLIELSIVLVIIGLLVGGVLVGKDMISAAGVRAQITQMEKFQQAVNIFKGKYNALPGDMDAATAAQFGFAARGPNPGQGDGNGIIQGNTGFGGPYGAYAGEPFLFWVDLSAAGLIEGSFTTATYAPPSSSVTGTSIGLYFPKAKISGSGNYVLVFCGKSSEITGGAQADQANYFTFEPIASIGTFGDVIQPATPVFTPAFQALTVRQAYAIDNKMDDGLAQTGNVISQGLWTNAAVWAMPLGYGFYNSTTGTTGNSVTCYDNGGIAGQTEQYSITQNNGTGPNCALSFKFQ